MASDEQIPVLWIPSLQEWRCCRSIFRIRRFVVGNEN